jgi:hypothetical protein
MTEKNKKKKETTPACNGTQLKATRHSTPPSLFRHVAQTLSSETAKGQPSDKSNTEGAVAMSASGDSPFTHRRLDCIQRLNLPLLAGGDCADWMRKQRFYRRATTL